jgi:hypothetical protein
VRFVPSEATCIQRVRNENFTVKSFIKTVFINIFASTYKYYSKFKTEEPRFSAVCFDHVSSSFSIFFLILLREFTGFDFFGMLPNKFYFLPVLFIWLFLVYRDYDKEKIDEVLRDFEHKSNGKRKLWGLTAVNMFILPLIIIAVLLTK